jgi:cytochrome c1
MTDPVAPPPPRRRLVCAFNRRHHRRPVENTSVVFIGANGTVGPDLTHVGHRRTIAAGTLSTTLANLEAWIIAPHSFKPGTIMPAPEHLSGSQMRVLATYVVGLR